MEQQTNEYLETSISAMEDVYRFVLNTYDVYNTPRDYGNGVVLTMVEMHTLVMVAEEPGLRITDLARKWNRTLGAASKAVNRLQKKGYVRKTHLPGNDKAIHVYATETGAELVRFHHQYDREIIAANLDLLLQKHKAEDLDTFHDVLLTFDTLVRNL